VPLMTLFEYIPTLQFVFYPILLANSVTPENKMPAKNPRTNLTLPADLDAVITDLARLQGTAKAKIITELLLEVQPVLEQMRDALQAVHENKDDALKVARDFAQSMMIEGGEKMGFIANEVKKL
jgi:hypothetical protein